MRAVEGAEPEVDDADGERRDVVTRPRNRRGNPRERRERQPRSRYAARGCSFTRLTSCVGFTKRSAISSHTSVTAM